MERREQTNLEAEAERIAARRADMRTPAVVRRAFLWRAEGGNLSRVCETGEAKLELKGSGRHGDRHNSTHTHTQVSALDSPLTLRAYLALEEAASPVLDGRWPSDDPRAMAEAFCTAWATVFPGRSIPDAKGLQDALELLHAEVERAFSTVMPMRFPRRPGDAVRAEQSDGLGWAARLIGRFVALGWRPDEVLDLPMDQLFILSAALYAQEGADCAGEDYRERETGERRAESGERSAVGAVDEGGDGEKAERGADKAQGNEKGEQELIHA